MELEQSPFQTPPDSMRRPIANKPTTPTKAKSVKTNLNTPALETLPKEPTHFCSEVCFLLGVVCFTIGLVGFVVDNFLSTRLGPLHSWLLILTAIASLTFGYVGKHPARLYCFGAGVFYLLLGGAGFYWGQEGVTSFGSLRNDPAIWNLIPNQLAFGTNDHVLHLMIGVVFIVGASLKKKTPKSGVHF